MRGVFSNSNQITRPNTLGLDKGHEENGLVLKAHHFGLNTMPARANHLADSAKRRHNALRLKR